MIDEEKRKEIAARLKTAREQAGLSQGQTARALRMHRPTISEIEAGRRRVSAEEISAFAELYGVAVDFLMASETDGGNPALELAARELSKLSKEDLDRVTNLLRTLRRLGEQNNAG